MPSRIIRSNNFLGEKEFVNRNESSTSSKPKMQIFLHKIPCNGVIASNLKEYFMNI